MKNCVQEWVMMIRSCVNLTNKAKQSPKRIVFAEADTYKILKAAQIIKDEGIATPILLGNERKIKEIMRENDLFPGGCGKLLILQAAAPSMPTNMRITFIKSASAKGYQNTRRKKLMTDRNYYGACMVQFGKADALISGLTKDYVSTIKPALQIIGTEEGINRVAGMYMMLTQKKGPVFFGDTTVNVDPSVQELVDITVLIERSVKQFNIVPKIAMLSYSNFGSNAGPIPDKVRETVRVLHEKISRYDS